MKSRKIESMAYETSVAIEKQLELLSLIGDVAMQDEKHIFDAHVDPKSGLALIKP